MNIELDPYEKKSFEDAARADGRDPADVVTELVRRYVAERSGAIDEHEFAEQDKAWDALLATLENLPSPSPADGVCASVEHDAILYGGPRSGQERGFPEKRS